MLFRSDSYAIITDFIEYPKAGDGTTDVTADINRALYQIFCRDINPSIRRSLFFPAGTYIITDTLLIPPYCKLYGEGSDSTIISFNIQPWTDTISYASGVLVEDSGSYYRSLASVPIGTPISSATYWAAESLPEYMFRTTDSLQQTGVNIGTGGALPPGFVEMSGIKFVANTPTGGALIEAAVNCSFDNIGIEGNGTTSTLTTATDNTAGVSFNSTGSYIVSNITWNNCQFTNMVWGVKTDEEAEGVTVSNCLFDTMYQGVYLGNIVAPAIGPTGFRIVQNKFDNVYAEGISIVNVGMNCSAYNAFYDVGNHFNGLASPATYNINIQTNNNISVGDMFEIGRAHV